MPDFEKDDRKTNGSTKKTISEMDDEYHNKFRAPKAEGTIQKDN